MDLLGAADKLCDRLWQDGAACVESIFIAAENLVITARQCLGFDVSRQTLTMRVYPAMLYNACSKSDSWLRIQ